jgi:hypothetical protein
MIRLLPALWLLFSIVAAVILVVEGAGTVRSGWVVVMIGLPLVALLVMILQ